MSALLAIDKLMDAMFEPRRDYKYPIRREGGSIQLTQPIEGEVYDCDGQGSIRYLGRDMWELALDAEVDSKCRGYGDEFDLPTDTQLEIALTATERAHQERDALKTKLSEAA